MTAGGVVYVRVSGATVPVTDQQTLAAMIAGGEAIRHGAEEGALLAARRLATESGTFSFEAVQVAIGLCPVGGPADRNAVLFSRTFLDRFQQLVYGRLQPDRRAGYSVAHSIHQDGVRVWPAAREWGSGWTAAAYWNGAVAAVFCDPSEEIFVEEFLARVRQGWTALAELAADYAQLAEGDPGDARVAVVFNRAHAGAKSLRRGVPPSRCAARPRSRRLQRRTFEAWNASCAVVSGSPRWKTDLTRDRRRQRRAARSRTASVQRSNLGVRR